MTNITHVTHDVIFPPAAVPLILTTNQRSHP